MRNANHDATSRDPSYPSPRGWRARIDLSVLDDESMPEEARARAAIETLHLHEHVFSYSGMSSLIARLSSAMSDTDWDEFDVELDVLYLIADQERVWLG